MSMHRQKKRTLRAEQVSTPSLRQIRLIVEIPILYTG